MSAMNARRVNPAVRMGTSRRSIRPSPGVVIALPPGQVFYIELAAMGWLEGAPGYHVAESARRSGIGTERQYLVSSRTSALGGKPENVGSLQEFRS